MATRGAGWVRLAVPGSVVIAAAWVARSAESTGWSAAVLIAEPFLAVAFAAVVYACFSTGRRALATGLLVAGVLSAAILRLPRPAVATVEESSPFGRTVAGCAPSLRLATGGFSLLQWTAAGVPAEKVVDAVVAQEADVTVLFGVGDPGVGAAVAAALGGEVHEHAEGETRVVVHTRGVFHPCGDEEEWTEGLEGPVGYTLAFVGAGEGVTLPLVAARLPHLRDSERYAVLRARSEARLAATLTAMQSSLAVVAADAEAPWSFRRLDAWMRALSLVPVRVPPSWPARAGGLPLLPLHPFDRVWAGPAWTVERSRRVAVPDGVRDAVRTEFQPAVRVAG